MKQLFIIIETYDEELDLRERFHVTFDKFKELLLSRWPELRDALKLTNTPVRPVEPVDVGPSDETKYNKIKI